jgi:hypothetical protein
MKIRITVGALLLGAALAGVPGCSFLLVRGPSAGDQRTAPVSCTRSNAVPIVDAALGATAIAVGAQLLAAGTSGWTGAYGVVGGGMLAEGAVFAASAIVGFHRTSRCRAAQSR